MKLSSFKNKYKGKRIFIIGNGPSLKGAQLNLIKDEYSFGVNRVSLMFPRTQWRPTFYFCSTVRAGQKDYGRDVKVGIQASKHAFLCDRVKEYIPKSFKNVTYFTCLHIGATYANPRDEWWAKDISDNLVSIYGTAVFGMTRIAAHMGFEEAYLLGCDLNYKPRNQAGADMNHFSTEYEKGTHPITKKWLNKEIPRMLKSHDVTQRMSLEKGMRIYNATPGGQVEAYPRVNLKDVIDG